MCAASVARKFLLKTGKVESRDDLQDDGLP